MLSPKPSTRANLEALLEDINALSIRLKKPGKETTQPALPLAARSVLTILKRNGPMTVPALGSVRGTSRQNIQVIVNRLKSEGFLSLVQNPAHKKSELVSLTDQGLSLLQKTEDPNERFVDSLMAQVSEEELLSASELLRRLREALAGHQPTVKRTSDVIETRKQRAESASVPEFHAEQELPVNLL